MLEKMVNVAKEFDLYLVLISDVSFASLDPEIKKKLNVPYVEYWSADRLSQNWETVIGVHVKDLKRKSSEVTDENLKAKICEIIKEGEKIKNCIKTIKRN